MEKHLYFDLVYNIFKIYYNKNYNYYIKTWKDKKLVKNIHVSVLPQCNYHVLWST